MKARHVASLTGGKNSSLFRGDSMKRALFAALVALLIGLMDAQALFAEVKFDYGAAFRLRQEIWDNLISLGTTPNTNTNYDRNFFRLRTQLWGKVEIDKTYGAYLRLTNEAKYYNGPYLNEQNTPKVYRSLEEDEVFVDNLYVDFKKAFGLPVDVRIGRQDFLGEFGDGFLILDGTPSDGSRSFYFNAAKVIITPIKNHSITLVALKNTKTDIFLPSLHSSLAGNVNYFQEKRMLNASDETGIIVYSKNKFGFLSVDPYYIWKSEDAIYLPTAPTVRQAPRSYLNTVGGRLEAKPENWTIKAEFAHQFGEYSNGVTRKADGGQASIGYAFKATPLKPELEVGYVYLSGDNPNTAGKNESWDPLWSRAPMWNELYIYTLINESVSKGGAIPGYWSNLQMFRINTKLHFCDSTNLMLGFNHMLAPESTSGLNANMFSNSGKDRGNIYQAMLKHKFSDKINGFLQLEHFQPGSYYNGNARNATFFRWELQFKL